MTNHDKQLGKKRPMTTSELGVLQQGRKFQKTELHQNLTDIQSGINLGTDLNLLDAGNLSPISDSSSEDVGSSEFESKRETSEKDLKILAIARQCAYNKKYNFDEVIKRLSKGEFDNINALDENECTLLDYAVDGNNIPCVKKLIEKKADVNFTTPGSNNPVVQALRLDLDNMEMINLLINNKADITAEGSRKNNMLHSAASSDKLEKVEFVLSHPFFKKSFIHEQDEFESTPLGIASLGNSPEIIKLLLKHGAKVTYDCISAAVSQVSVNIIDILWENSSNEVKNKVIADNSLLLEASRNAAYEDTNKADLISLIEKLIEFGVPDNKNEHEETTETAYWDEYKRTHWEHDYD